MCDIRLDFETFTTLAPADTNESTGGACPDTFIATSSTSGVTYPTLCGDLTGEHMYVNLGQGSGTAGLRFSFTGTGTRQFEIKVTQIECNNAAR